MGTHNRVSPLLKYRVQKEFLVNCSNPNSVRANGGLSKALQRFETEKIKKNLEKSFFNTNKYIRYCEEIQEKSKNIKRGREVVGEMLMKRQKIHLQRITWIHQLITLFVFQKLLT